MPGRVAVELRRHPDDDVIEGGDMDLLLGALGMLACIAIMAAVMPLAMRLGRRLTRSSDTTSAPGGTTSTPQPPGAPAPRPPRQEPG
jgi:hypothetical protein